MEQLSLESITVWGFAATILSTLFSIGSGWFAYKQFKKAQNAANSAMQAKAFLLERKISMDLIDFIKDAQRIERLTISYLKVVNGRNVDLFINGIQGMLSQLNIIKSTIDANNPLRMKLNKVYDSINMHSGKLKDDDSYWYNSILDDIRELISIINSTSNKNIYQ